MEVCYLVRQDEISASDLDAINSEINQFHHFRQAFISSGVRVSISLPRQHALIHYPESITLFGSPNGLCSSITESKHIKAVKEPWRRSSRNHPLPQMLQTITRMEKMAAIQVIFLTLGMLHGGTSAWEEGHKQARALDDEDTDTASEAPSEDAAADIDNTQTRQPPELRDTADAGASDESDTLISLAAKRRMYN